MKYILASLTVMLMMSGCAIKQQMNLVHNVQSAASTDSNLVVTLEVNDNRDYILNGKKKKSFIGLYRGGFGNPWDVNTRNNIPLEDLFKNDLTEELTSLGFIKEGTSKSLLIVNINKWKFDTYQNIKFDYDIDIKVVNLAKSIFVQNKIAKTVNIKGSFWTGPIGAAEREIPKLYTQIIQQIVRENKEILQALKQH